MKQEFSKPIRQEAVWWSVFLCNIALHFECRFNKNSLLRCYFLVFFRLGTKWSACNEPVSNLKNCFISQVVIQEVKLELEDVAVDEETLAGDAKEKIRAMIENGEPKKAICKLAA